MSQAILLSNAANVTVENLKYMFIRKMGRSIDILGHYSKNDLEAELIVVYDEDEDYYIGHYAVGYGFTQYKFAKADCRDVKENEIREWAFDPINFKF